MYHFSFISLTAQALVRSSQWRRGLRQLRNDEPIMNDKMPGSLATPCMPLAMMYNVIILEVALDVLDRCTVEYPKTQSSKHRVAFNFEFLESFKETG